MLYTLVNLKSYKENASLLFGLIYTFDYIEVGLAGKAPGAIKFDHLPALIISQAQTHPVSSPQQISLKQAQAEHKA